MPIVSFILPAYKRRFLSEAIKSILAQTHRDLELVIVDDASPDNLKEIVDEFHDERLSYHRNSENIGGKNLVEAWNHAMKYATGEWCVLASDDDVYASEFLETLLELSIKYPDVDLFHCRVGEINEKSEIICLGDCRNEFETIWEMLYSRGVKRKFQFAPDFMFRRKSLEQLGGFINFPCAIYSDDATWYALSKVHGVVCSSKCLYYWRISEINTCGKQDNILYKAQASLKFKEWIDEFISTLPSPITENDKIFKQLVEKNISNAVKNLLIFFLSNARFRNWRRIMKQLSDMPAQWRRDCWQKRLDSIASYCMNLIIRAHYRIFK